MRRLLVPSVVLPVVCMLSACNGARSALDPKGPAAFELSRLIWLFTALSGIVWLLVMATLASILIRNAAPRNDPLALSLRQETRMTNWVALATGLTAIILVGLTLLSYLSNRTLAGIVTGSAVTIRVTGHQWWWEIRYENPRPSRVLFTANEIHIPAGEPVRLVLASTDVIHSFWVPSLAGKLDLIPGQENVLDLQADKVGVYRGQCAEFCGAQHAHMGIFVVAQSRPDFDAWLAHQLQPAPQPASADEENGRQFFMKRSCVMCHKIGGTTAGANAGPDLTHVASRMTIAAGALPMGEENLAAWVSDPQSIKPGTHMPVPQLDGDEVGAIASYLDGLR